MGVRVGRVLALTASAVGFFASPAAALTHVVEPGDTLSEIAVTHDVTVAGLVERNGLSQRDLITVGQVLVVDARDIGGAPTDPPSPASEQAAAVPPEASIPDTAVASPAAPAMVPVAAGATYRVNAGDTLSGVAWRLGVRTQAIIDLNQLVDPDRLQLGQLLRVPESSEPVSSVATPWRLLADPERTALIPSFDRWAEDADVSTELVMAIAYVESEWDADAVSSTGAQGIGQIVPSTATFVSRNLLGLESTLDATDPDANIRMMAHYVAPLRQETNDDTELLASYHHGLGTLQQSGLTDATRRYAASVQAWQPHFAGL